ncbi:MAG: Rieske 2Fe-2S domain-containing protein [Actinomycetota bacterium]
MEPRIEPLLRDAMHRIAETEALDGLSKAVKKAFDGVVKGGDVKDLLAGTWLGHPLHPALTDVPLGVWTSSWILDIVGGRKARTASDALLGIGILSAVPTALSGLTDWTDTWGKTQRVGMAHAVGNTAALTLFTLSFASRRRGRRLRGFVLSSLGMAVSTASAYLGGHLAFGRGVGVDNTVFDREPEKWTSLVGVEALTEGMPLKAGPDRAEVLLFKDGDAIHAISDNCSHRGCSLADGDVEDLVVQCPCHGSSFRLRDGSVVRGPATSPQPAYETRVVEGRVEVRLREEKN